MNPLLQLDTLPHFNSVTPAHVGPAVDTLLAEFHKVVASLEAATADHGWQPSWDNFVQPMDNAGERLFRAWGQVGHLNAVVNSPAMRDAYNSTLPKITAFMSELGQNQALYTGFQTLRNSPGFADLSPAQQKVVENELRDFRLSGAELEADDKTRFLEIQQRLSELSSRFSDNVLDATNAWSKLVSDASELAGLPQDVLASMREAAENDGAEGWKITLHMPHYLPILQYCDNQELRAELYRAFATRASEFGDSNWDNSPLIDEILSLRAEKAKLLGFASFAELSLATKMADTPDDVLTFLYDLGKRAKPAAEQDLAELRQYAADELGFTAELQSWDIAWVSEKLRVARYAFSANDVKQYFPEDRVIEGMFKVVQSIYGITITAKEAETWHDSVRFYEVSRDGQAIAQFYLDNYARNHKQGGAWMDNAINRKKLPAGRQLPVAYLTCNFSGPVGNLPAQFTHDEVTTLFHEFGHGLHHMLTEVEEQGVTGINGVEWDAVELPSQFMENYCWEWEVLQDMTAHVDSGEPLPRELYDKMLAARNFQSGMFVVRQLEFALFDLHLHHDHKPTDSIQDLTKRVRDAVAVMQPPAWHRHANAFSHIFAGGYAAGYYSYLWAEVLSADAYSLFEEDGVLSREAGQRFLDEVISVGGSRPALDSFKAFRGREPSLDAMLRHKGLTDSAAAA